MGAETAVLAAPDLVDAKVTEVNAASLDLLTHLPRAHPCSACLVPEPLLWLNIHAGVGSAGTTPMALDFRIRVAGAEFPECWPDGARG